MASINKLSIRGVRAFSPEDEEQCVEFFFPCTIILGQNGCGKTTIIEALKFAITGSYPPGMGRNGSSFVHDPKSIGNSSVKANIKLRFTSRASQTMVVVRSMELTQRKVKATFKQLDGVLRTFDPDSGERVSLSHKCGELDKQIPSLLGVSKAILEHVVFCHQEESSWPLQDAASLKKRFDDIFDSTKYSKALKAFRDTEKDYVAKAKDLQVDVAELGAHKQAAKGFRAELEEQHEKADVLTEHKKEINQRIESVDKGIGKAREKLDQVEEVNSDLDAKTNELDQEERMIDEKRRMVEEDVTSLGLEVLQKQLSNFDQNMRSELDKKVKLEESLKTLEHRMEELREAQQSLSSRQGKLHAEKESHEKNLRARFSMMERIARDHKLDLTQMTQSQTNTSIVASLSQSMTMDDESVDMTMMTITPDDMHGFYEGLDSKHQELNDELDDLKARFRDEDQKLSSAVAELDGQIRGMEIEKNRLTEERQKAENEMNQLKGSSGKSRVRKTDVEERRRKAAAAARERDEVMNDPRRGEIQLEIRQFERKIEDVKQKIEDEATVFDALRSSLETHNAISTLKEQCAKDIDALDEAIRDEAYSLSKFGIPVPDALPREDDPGGEDLKKTVELMERSATKKFSKATEKLRLADDNLMNSQKSVSEKTALFTGNQRSLTSARSKLQPLSKASDEFKATVQELKELETSYGASFEDIEEDPNTIIRYLNKQVETIDSQLLADHSKIAKKVTKKFLTQIRDEHLGETVSCPCCKSKINEEILDAFLGGLYETTKELYPAQDDNFLSNLKKKKAAYQSIRKKIEVQKDSLRDSQRLSREVATLEKEGERYQDELSQFCGIHKKHVQQKNELQAEVNGLRVLGESIRRWQEDSIRVSEKKQQIAQKKQDIASLGSGDDRDFKTVEKDLARLREEKDSYGLEINHRNREVSEINKRENELSSKSRALDEEAKRYEDQYSKELKDVERKKELATRAREIAARDAEISAELSPLQQRKNKKSSELKRTRDLYAGEEKTLQTKLEAFRSDRRDLENLSNQIEAYEGASKHKEFEKVSSKSRNIVDEVESKKQEIEDLKPNLESLTKAVDDQERHKRNMEQNISILQSISRVKVLTKEVSKLEAQREKIGGASALEEHEALVAKRDGLLQEKARTDGTFSSHLEQIRSLKRKLMLSEYKNVEEDYRRAKIKHTTTKLASQDLKKYGNALDKALLQFHGVKIQEINKIIRELWLMTYKGEDITNIEIQSGQEAGSKAAKSYNYRVVMTKGGAKMDMRGRCSAGQRVLASIVIRLGLAETFGVNCGCIALDEPTVNLDEENKAGLAVSLAHIISNRAQQRNFQLLLITHDEDFIKAMKLELASMTGFSMPEKYFQVSRELAADGKFYSKVRAVGLEEL